MGNFILSGEVDKSRSYIDQKLWGQIHSNVSFFPFLSAPQVLGHSALN